MDSVSFVFARGFRVLRVESGFASTCFTKTTHCNQCILVTRKSSGRVNVCAWLKEGFNH